MFNEVPLYQQHTFGQLCKGKCHMLCLAKTGCSQFILTGSENSMVHQGGLKSPSINPSEVINA